MKKVAVNIVETLLKRVVVEVPDGVDPADVHYFVMNRYHAGTDDFLVLDSSDFLDSSVELVQGECDDEADYICDEHMNIII